MKILLLRITMLILIALIFYIQHIVDNNVAKEKQSNIKKQETISVLETIINSIQQNPNQFKLNITTIGTVGIGRPGSPGIIGIANGTGGTNIGFQSNATTSNINIEKNVGGAIDEQVSKALLLLKDLKIQIESEKPDESAIKSILDKIQSSILPEFLSKVLLKVILG
ncbi:MAG TPA: hypothetical protein VMT55_04005 [Candidatus Sulfotelmatobacter sp.]|nr:hypothetical protein [Candidatus Sulfotelmatobacter sp.]